MTDEARKAYNAYIRAWRKANRDKVSANNARYWERKAEKARQAAEARNEK